MKHQSKEIRKIAEHKDLGRAVWIKLDETAEIYELFASESGDDYIGCADTVNEARAVARDWFYELQCY